MIASGDPRSLPPGKQRGAFSPLEEEEDAELGKKWKEQEADDSIPGSVNIYRHPPPSSELRFKASLIRNM